MKGIQFNLGYIISDPGVVSNEELIVGALGIDDKTHISKNRTLDGFSNVYINKNAILNLTYKNGSLNGSLSATFVSNDDSYLDKVKAELTEVLGRYAEEKKISFSINNII